MDTGFKFSKSKTLCVHFCSQTKMHNELVIKLKETKIPLIKQYKFLGIIFGKKKKKRSKLYTTYQTFKIKMYPSPTNLTGSYLYKMWS